MKEKKLNPFLKVIKAAASVAFLCVWLFPIVIIIFSSLKSKQELAVNTFGPPQEVTFEYFRQAAEKMNFFGSTLNTIFVALVVVICITIFASMAAYAISRGSKRIGALYYFFLAGLLVPFQMTMIPTYKLILSLNLMDSLWGVILIYIATRAPFSIFLLTGFVKSIPRELEEAAYMDGAGRIRTYFSIVFPLLKGPLTTVGILNIFTVWNDFLMPMLFLQQRDKLTLTVTLSNFQGMYFNDWSMIFAGVCLIVVPLLIIYLAAQKWIIGGLTSGAVKG